MNYTPQQKHAAFYQAAASIEARPDLYNFDQSRVGEDGCTACMWGHAGRCLGLAPGTINGFVAKSFGFDGDTGILYFFGDERENFSANEAAQKLRAFADHHWPQKPESLPDWDAIATHGVTA
jgi:hypothetical protein